LSRITIFQQHYRFADTSISDLPNLQDFLPQVAQAAVREDWVDVVGLGRMALSYPELLRDVLEGRAMARNLVCRTFSDCTTAPRNNFPSGCYPLDRYYKESELGARLQSVKTRIRAGAAQVEEEE